MIIDSETNLLYLADSLPVKYPEFTIGFRKSLVHHNIAFNYLNGTKDIWAVDYMPIQLAANKFVGFKYLPDYLLRSAKERETISDTDQICTTLGIDVVKSEIILDGGNIIRWKNKVIMTDKVIRENPSHKKTDLLNLLTELFEVDQIILIPQDPYDEIGHSDGMIRFLDGDTVLLNDYSKETKKFQNAVHKALSEAGLAFEIIPYNPYANKYDLQATGVYINYLQMEDVLFVPVYGMSEDDEVVRRLENLFPGLSIVPIESTEIADQGGVLNCICWNILKP
ncbi:agmatine deiminase family protein [Flavitalea sp.]|nr:agmatine deiminase family protein [Flavitalea sp.]